MMCATYFQVIQKINLRDRRIQEWDKMNTIGLSGQRLYEGNSLYYSCNFLVSLKLYQNKKWQKREGEYILGICSLIMTVCVTCH